MARPTGRHWRCLRLQHGDRTWRRAATRPRLVMVLRRPIWFGEIYVPGGLLADGRPTTIVEAYSPSQDAWRRVAPLPPAGTGRAGPCLMGVSMPLAAG